MPILPTAPLCPSLGNDSISLVSPRDTMCLVDTKRAVPLAACNDLGVPTTTYYYDAHFLTYSAEVLASSPGSQDPAGAIGGRRQGSSSNKDNSQSGKSKDGSPKTSCQPRRRVCVLTI